MSLKDRIQEDVKHALRGKDRQRLGVLRLIMAAVKQREVDERISLDDDGIVLVLDKMSKQRQDSLDQYTKAGRDDLAAQERFELDVLATYLPEPLGEAELSALIDEALADTGAASMRDMGAVMSRLRPHVQGRADMKQVSTVVRNRLGA